MRVEDYALHDQFMTKQYQQRLELFLVNQIMVFSRTTKEVHTDELIVYFSVLIVLRFRFDGGKPNQFEAVLPVKAWHANRGGF